METHFRKIWTNLMCQKYLRLNYDGVAHRAFYFFFIVSTKQPFLSLIDGIFFPFHSWNTMLSHPHDWNSKNIPFLIFAGISSRSAVTSLKARLCLKRSAMTTKYSHYGMAKLSQKSIRWIRHGLSESSIGPTVQMCTQIITPGSFSANIKC